MAAEDDGCDWDDEIEIAPDDEADEDAPDDMDEDEDEDDEMYSDDVNDEVDIDFPEGDEDEESDAEDDDLGSLPGAEGGDDDDEEEADDDESEDDRGSEGDFDEGDLARSFLTGFFVTMDGEGEGSKFSPERSPKSKLFEDFVVLEAAGTAFGACSPSRLMPERSPKLRGIALPFPLFLFAVFLLLILISQFAFLLILMSERSPKSNSPLSSSKMAVVPFLALTDAIESDDDEDEDEDDWDCDDSGDDEFPCIFLPFLVKTVFFSISSHLFLFLFRSRLISSSLLRMSSVFPASGAVSFGGSNDSLAVFTFWGVAAPQKRLMCDTVRCVMSRRRWGPVAVELMRRCLLTRFPEKDRELAEDVVRALSADFISFWWNS